MPITRIAIENFKGIGTPVEIPLRSINLLFGANSAGKSTILQAMLYMRELLERMNADADTLRASGQSIDLGGFEKLVHGRDLKRVVKIGIGVSVDDDGLDTYRRTECDDDEQQGSAWDRQLPLPGIHEVMVSVSVGWDTDKNRVHFLCYEVEVNGVKVGKIENLFKEPLGNSENPITLTINQDHPIFAKLLNSLSSDNSDNWRRDHNNEEVVGPLGYFHHAVYNVLPTVIPRFGHPLYLQEDQNTDSTQLSLQDAEELFSHILVGAGQKVLDELMQVRYIGPIRMVPNRHFQPVLTPTEARWADGSAAWDLLYNNDVESRHFWFNEVQFDQLQLGYQIEVEEYFEVRRHSELGSDLWKCSRPDSKGLSESNLYPKEVLSDLIMRRRLKITSGDGTMNLSPSDIGVGISQLVPVVIGAMAPGYSLLAVEQPELHVHPAVQCRLADLLAHQVLGRERLLLLETHSEHLMLRLLRRVRETAEDELPPDAPSIAPDDLAVFYVANDHQGLTITELPVNCEGDFDKQWPKGFFEERAAELF
jgi:hypothetical protein